ncbi:MAG: alpha/beta hydrolase [Minisyncoccales bacterium]
MKQQVVLIHGGNTFENYGEYISCLKNKKIDLDYFRLHKEWKSGLPDNLGESFDVLAPRMPNGSNAQYGEWKIWFQRLLELLDDGAIFIGHSLGAIFLVKYFSENKTAKKIKAAILIGAPHDDEGGNEKLASFALARSLDGFGQQVPDIYLLHSHDDPVVPFLQLEKYKKALPGAKEMIFQDKGHFNMESFPEITDLIKNIAEK